MLGSLKFLHGAYAERFRAFVSEQAAAKEGER